MPKNRDETSKFRDNVRRCVGDLPRPVGRETMKKILAAIAVASAAMLATPAFAALDVGVSAPEFSAKGMLGGNEFTFKLSDALKKGPVVIYFFPAAYTP